VQPRADAIAKATSVPEGEVEPGRALAVDTHCHLFLMEEDAAQVLARAKRAGVGVLICAGIDAETSRRSAELAESFRGVFATAGVHPHTASEFDQRTGTVIEELLSNPMVVAVGETGLDYLRNLSPPEDQRRAFKTHIALSRETGKPLVVHVRDAWEDALSILAAEGAERVVLHCFSGDEAIAREAQARGYFCSFAGNITYPKADHLRRAAASIDAGHLLVETDSPFLSPQEVRGSANSPSNLMAVLRTLAEVSAFDLGSVIASTAEAALAAFPMIR
jgi:TatD DNase family protein